MNSDSNTYLDADLEGIISLARRHIQIRNRSWMKRIHRDCFVGNDLIEFLIMQGLADNRKIALEMCRKMVSRNLVKQVTERSSSLFSDSYHYYRFAEDDLESSVLANSNAGNGNGIHPGHGGCKFSFSPHTAHNSYIIDIALAEEIERSVAGASVQARAHAIDKLRARVREQAEPEAPDWSLTQSVTVNQTKISVFQRKRPRGNWKNVKMTGMVGESPVGFIRGLLSFRHRKQWESLFEDGVVVDNVDTDEPLNAMMQPPNTQQPTSPQGESDKSGQWGSKSNSSKKNTPSNNSPNPNVEESSPGLGRSLLRGIRSLALPEAALKKQQKTSGLARTTDDVIAFLQTVDLAGVPPAMAVAFLNDPERQHALAHLRKQMMLSNPQECMLCQSGFDCPNNDIRFCPCCAMVCCASCVCKRVFEVVSRTVVSICLHCFRESSRVRLPPQAVQDDSHIDEALRGKWWRPGELGLVDYSESATSEPSTPSRAAHTQPPLPHQPSVSEPAIYNDQDMLIVDCKELRPLIPGLFMGTAPGAGEDYFGHSSSHPYEEYDQEDGDKEAEEDTEEGDSSPASSAKMRTKKGSVRDSADVPIDPPFFPITPPGGGGVKTATCKHCGALISRDVESIEAHMDECQGGGAAGNPQLGGPVLRNKNSPSLLRQKNSSSTDPRSYFLNENDGSMTVTYSPGTSKTFAGFLRRFEAAPPPSPQTPGSKDPPTSPSPGNLSNTRIIYRTASSGGTSHSKSREVTAFQDSFVDPDGTCYVYEISVRHCEARGLPGYVTADVMSLIHVARPVKGSKNMCEIAIISQVDTRDSKWMLLSFLLNNDASNGMMGGVGRDDLIRELRQGGSLQNILRNEQDSTDEISNLVSLDDFELLAVLGRGGFGKVMQVRHKQSGAMYAMKILKKSELRRRRQVERTQTERTILANVRHPFIVCLHYAFQSTQKLYMVMDFVQGGDFFTLMRKVKRLPEDWVRLYVMQIALALQHLHCMDVVYRDLKPENILLSLDGHLKLTDFGLSRFFETRPPAAEDMVENSGEAVTRSFCGTEQYMSPEMLLQQGHNYRMDWWCVGLLMHEMISARHPFHGPSHYDTLRNMVTKTPEIDDRLSPAAASLVKSLLVKNPRARLCCKPDNKGNGIVEMKGHPFFRGLDWDLLLARQLKMPYIPQLASDSDVSFFETTFTKERPVDSVVNTERDKNDPKGKNKSTKKGLGGFFGLGGGAKGPKGEADRHLSAAELADSFKGFSFTKEDTDISSS